MIVIALSDRALLAVFVHISVDNNYKVYRQNELIPLVSPTLRKRQNFTLIVPPHFEKKKNTNKTK